MNFDLSMVEGEYNFVPQLFKCNTLKSYTI